VRVLFHAEQPVPPSGPVPGRATRLVDLGFPCALACPRCDHVPFAPSYHRARRRLLEAAGSPGVRELRAGFYGGDPFALPRSFEALLEEVQAECTRRGRRFHAVALSTGMRWSADRLRRAGALGLGAVQVVLDGPPELHDPRHPSREHGAGAGSFARIVETLKYERGDAAVVVRTDASLEAEALEDLANRLDDEGLFAPPNPVALLVADLAPYPVQARDLLELATDGGPGDAWRVAGTRSSAASP
jgi:sulfatase maturation enzyme AslB (radical SAM superfamily)